MKHRFTALLALVLVSLTITGSAFAFDCIRVSSSHQGLVSSTSHSGKWLLFDLSSGPALQQTLGGAAGLSLTDEQAACIAEAYAATGQPLFFALGTGVAGGNNPNSAAGGVIAHNNPNDGVLGNGKGIDHLDDSPILPALFGAAEGCGVSIPMEG
jgi:hypothetical protein